MTNTKPNAKRKRPMVTLTLAPGSLTLIDKRRGKLARGEFIELLLETTPDTDETYGRVLYAKELKQARRKAKR